MKILHTVEFYHPSTGGAQEVVRQLSERLVKMGHEVTVATTKLPERKERTLNGVKIVEFDISGNAARGFKGEVDRYKNFLVGSKFDVVMNYAAQQWTADLFFEVMGQVSAKKVFVPCGFSGLQDPLYRKYFDDMPKILQKYDASVYLSDNYQDIKFSKRLGIKKTHLIPNGASEDEFLPPNQLNIRKKLGIPENDFLVLHVGSHTGIKGHREAIEIFKRSKLRNSTLLIVGNDLGSGCLLSCKLKALVSRFSPSLTAANKKIVVTSLGREETVSAYKSSDIFLFPSNTEMSPIVLFEAAAAKLPFLSTDVGNAREIAKWTGDGLILSTIGEKRPFIIDDIYEPIQLLKEIIRLVIPKIKSTPQFLFADIDTSTRMLEKLAADEVIRRKMAQAGFEAWREKFTWEKISQEYERLYQGLVSEQS